MFSKVIDFFRISGRRYWFAGGLFAAVSLTLIDASGNVAAIGKWFSSHRGAEAAIFTIFLVSAVELETEKLREGLTDWKAIGAALLAIFCFAPLVAKIYGLLPLSAGMRIGLSLVAVMPCTLSSGVVMTEASGGNTATALAITILANIVAIFTIPLVLPIVIGEGLQNSSVIIDRGPLMFRIATLVLVPLGIGTLGRSWIRKPIVGRGFRVSVLNQYLIILVVWMAASESRTTIVANVTSLAEAFTLAFCYHLVLLGFAFSQARLFRLGAKRRLAVIFMGAQKTLPLSILLQITLFPQYGEALVFCLIHHITHLLIDGCLVGIFNPASDGARE